MQKMKMKENSRLIMFLGGKTSEDGDGARRIGDWIDEGWFYWGPKYWILVGLSSFSDFLEGKGVLFQGG